MNTYFSHANHLILVRSITHVITEISDGFGLRSRIRAVHSRGEEPQETLPGPLRLLGQPRIFPTRTNDLDTALSRTLMQIKIDYLHATNPAPASDTSEEDSEARAQDVFDRELSRAFGRVASRSELDLLSHILDAMTRHQLRTYESTQAYLKAKAYLDEKDEVDTRRAEELRNRT